jgi:hypothetical protein
MTVEYLVFRDLYKAEQNLERARKRTNVPKEELEQLEELLELRKQIAERILYGTQEFHK